ncbi:MAG: hypothetical protein ACI9QQ_003076, partial [Myxococcota bacterium]
ELYPHRPLEIYGELVDAAGGVAPIIKRALSALEAGDLQRAQLLIEVAREGGPNNPDVVAAEIKILAALREHARATTNTFSEVAWLQSEISRAPKRLTAK